MPEQRLTLLTRLHWLPARSVISRELWPESCRLISTNQVNRVSFLCREKSEMSFSFPLPCLLFVCLCLFYFENVIHEQDITFTPVPPTHSSCFSLPDS